MYIKQICSIKDFYLKEGETIDFHYPKYEGINVNFKSLSDSVHKPGTSLIACEALIEIEPGIKNDNIFRKIENNEYYSFEKSLNFLISFKRNDINYIVPGIDFFPKYFQDFIHQTKNKLTDAVNDIYKNFRWVYNIEGKNNPITSYACYWSRDLNTWFPLPDRITGTGKINSPLKVTKSKNQIIKDLLKYDISEPEYHILFREALFQINENPRSSLVIAVAALEIAVKDCIQHFVPNSSWLLENMPSPSVEKILKNYIPILLIKYNKSHVILSERVLSEVRKAVTIRNEIVHKGNNAPQTGSIKIKLNVINDILLIIDFYKGHTWALKYLSEETKKESF